MGGFSFVEQKCEVGDHKSAAEESSDGRKMEGLGNLRESDGILGNPREPSESWRVQGYAMASPSTLVMKSHSRNPRES